MTAKKQNPPKAKETTVEQNNLLDRVIAKIIEDQAILADQNDLIEKAKSYKNEVVARIREARKDLVTIAKYGTPEQIERLKELDLDLETNGQGLNAVAKLCIAILEKTTKGEMTNEELYNAYVATFKSADDALTYTEVNIKLRSLFQNQKLLRKEPANAQSSREHVISINGFRSNN